MKSIIIGACAFSLAVFLAGCGPSQEELRTIGISEYQKGHHQLAEGYFQRVLSTEPSDALCLFYMGRMCQTQKQTVKAYQYYQAAIDADPGFAYAASTRRYMKEVEQELGPELTETLRTNPKFAPHPVP